MRSAELEEVTVNIVVKCLLVAFVALARAGAETHAGPVDVRAPLDRDGAVEVDLMDGSLRVVGWDREEVQVTGVVGRDILAVAPAGDRRSVRLEFQYRHPDDNRHVEAQLVVHLPRAAEIAVDSMSAPVEVSEFAGKLSIQTLDGDIRASGGRRVRAETLSGRIELASPEPIETVDAESLSGAVTVSGPLAKNADVRIEAFSGGVTLRLPADTDADFAVSTFYSDLESDFGGPPSDRPSHRERTIRFSAGSGGAKVSISSFSGPVKILEQ